MTHHPNDISEESKAGSAAEQRRESVEQPFPGEVSAKGVEHPFDEGGKEEEQETTEATEGAEQGTTWQPRGDYPAERLRDFVEQRFPEGLPGSSLPWDTGGEEPEAEGDKDAEQGTGRQPRGDYPAERLRDFIEQRFPEGLPGSSLPWDPEQEEPEAGEDTKEDAEDATG